MFQRNIYLHDRATSDRAIASTTTAVNAFGLPWFRTSWLDNRFDA